jgi:hypothetical protein
MKPTIRLLSTAFFFLALILTSCGKSNQNEGADDMHKQHSSLADHFSHKDIIILDQPYQPAKATRTELEQVIESYLQVKDALVKDDEDAVNRAVGVMSEKVLAVIPTQLEDKGLEAWQNHKDLYEAKLEEMRHITGLSNKRSYFSHISEIMYCTIKSFELQRGKLFAVFCPMAFAGGGAYWINESKTIQNPYMGAKMPACGEIKEDL